MACVNIKTAAFAIILCILCTFANYSSAQCETRCKRCPVFPLYDILDPYRRINDTELIKILCVRGRSSPADDTTIFTEFSITSTNIKEKLNFTLNCFAFITHGWGDNYPGRGEVDGQAWLKQTATYLADNGCNVCVIDWHTLANVFIPYGNMAKSNVPRVANYTAQFIRFLKANGANVTRIAFAGHGLGAHLGGQVGYNLTTTGDKLGSIYGLDPSKLCFKTECDPLTAILDDSDANFVEIYHTNERFFGTDCSYGCLDYKLNGGDHQPGCRRGDDLCSHRFAYRFFAGIIRLPGIAHDCFDAANNHILGFHGQNNITACVARPIFLRTNAADPFCARCT